MDFDVKELAAPLQALLEDGVRDGMVREGGTAPSLRRGAEGEDYG